VDLWTSLVSEYRGTVLSAVARCREEVVSLQDSHPARRLPWRTRVPCGALCLQSAKRIPPWEPARTRRPTGCWLLAGDPCATPSENQRLPGPGNGFRGDRHSRISRIEFGAHPVHAVRSSAVASCVARWLRLACHASSL